MLAIDARDVAKTFRAGFFRRRETVALAGVSLGVPRGAIFGLLGPNGAGKTTLLSIFATLLLPDRGTVTVLGHDVVREAGALRRRVNMASGNASFVWSMRVAEILDFYGRLYGLRGAELTRRREELIELVDLQRHRSVPYNALSTGLKQRLALAKALVNEPELLFLDEPTLGLDPDVAARMREHVRELQRQRGMTVLLTTHYMREAEEMCNELAFMHQGRIVARGTPRALMRRIGLGDVLRLTLEPPHVEGLVMLPGVIQVHASGEAIECVVDDAGKRLHEILGWLWERGVEVRRCEVHESDLERVFVDLAR